LEHCARIKRSQCEYKLVASDGADRHGDLRRLDGDVHRVSGFIPDVVNAFQFNASAPSYSFDLTGTSGNSPSSPSPSRYYQWLIRCPVIFDDARQSSFLQFKLGGERSNH